jgi:Holliday junction resolvase RusA-like endonuclease
MICERCNADIYPPPNRPDWRKCPACTFGGGAHAARRRYGPAPAYPLPPATPTKVTWVVPGPPLSVNRVHGLAFKNGKRVMYFTKEGKAYKLSVAAHALQALGRVQWDRTRRYALTLIEYFDNPRADSDNPLKVVKDALQGVLFDNDVQVVSDHTEKHIDKIAPRLVCTVTAMEE